MAILRDSTDEDRRALIRTLAASAMIRMVGTVVLAVIPFSNLVSRSRPDSAKLALLLIPQALPLSIPLGLAFGILWGLGRVTASRRARTLILSLAALASVASFTMLDWVVPTANQAFRVSMIGRPVAKGANELTLGELRQLLEPGSREPMSIAAPSDRRSLAFTYHMRWALAGAPLVFALFAVALTSRRRWGRVMPPLTGCLAILSYWGVMHSAMWLGLDRILSAFGAAWAPNVAFLILSAAVTTNSYVRIPDIEH
jgi:lipopolysaccharide export LptBFGC system permease protein LptF